MKFNYLTGKYGEKIFNLGTMNHYSISLSEDIVVTAGADIIVFWKISGGEIMDVINTLYGESVFIEISDDMTLMAVFLQCSRTFYLWSLETKREIMSFEGHEGKIKSILFIDDDKKLLSCSTDETVRMWDAGTGKEIRKFEGHGGEIEGIEVSPDEELLAATNEDKTIKVWNMETGDLIHTLSGFEDGVTDVAISSTKKIIAGSSYDETVRIWCLPSGKEIACLHPNIGRIGSCSFINNGRILEICSLSKLVKHCDTETFTFVEKSGISVFAADFTIEDEHNIFSVIPRDRRVSFHIGYRSANLPSFLRDNKYDMELHPGPGKFRHNIHIITDKNCDEFIEIKDNKDDLKTFRDFKGKKNLKLIDASLITKPFDADISLINEKTGKEIFHTEGYTGGSNSVAFSHDGRLLASGTHNEKLHIRDVETGEILITINDHYDFLCTKTPFSPDDGFIFHCNYEGTVCMMEVSTGSKVREFPIHINFDFQGELLAGVVKDSEKVCVWNAMTGEIIREIDLEGMIPGEVCLSGDGNMIAARCYNEFFDVLLIDLRTDTRTFMPKEIITRLGSFEAFSFSPDNSMLAIGDLGIDGDHSLILWDIARQEIIREIEEDNVYCVAFSPDGNQLAYGGDSEIIKICNVETGEIIREFRGHTDIVETLAFSPDGKLLASSSWDGTVRVWELEMNNVQCTVNNE